MDRLAEMEAFLAVVDHGGFTDAAKRIGISKSAVSKHVSSLEARLGARLLNRTTRRVSPTEIGLAYYDKATRVIADATEADAMVNAMQSAPRGELRISAPVSFGTTHLAPAVSEFLKAYPDVSVHMVMDDRFVELVSEGFDLAIRIGELPDSTLRARKLAEAAVYIVGSPEYFKEHGHPKTIEDLSEHTLLHYSNMATGNYWRLKASSGAERQIRVGGRLTANNGDALLKGAISGVGLSLIPSFIVGDAIKNGLVEAVLTDCVVEKLGIFAVYPPGRFPQPKLRAFIEFMAAHFKQTGGDTLT
ncbi:MAG: LysR family transcriptional regulator [Pseudomonadota bacterium]